MAYPLARLAALLGLSAEVAGGEMRALLLAFLGNFMLLGSYYVLRPVRDTVATIFRLDQLPWLFTATFIGCLIASPLYAALAARVRLSRLLPGVFGFWLLNVLVFQLLFQLLPSNRWVAGSYYVWFSISNLYMISVFWSLLVDLFSAAQATRLFALIAAGGELGAIAGAILTRLLAVQLGLAGLLLIPCAGLLGVIVLMQLLVREKRRLGVSGTAAQRSTLDHRLAGNPLEGFAALFKSRYALLQAAFMLLMTWVNTVAYFLQTDLLSHTIVQLAGRVQALADIDLAVNVATAVILLFGMGRYLQRFGVTAALVLNPLLMVVAFFGVVASPTLLMIQLVQIVRRVAQYAIARPSREICFTVVPQSDRYKSKNVIDTVIYRFGDLSSAWMQGGLRLVGFGLGGLAGVGALASLLWAAVALGLGAGFERRRRARAAQTQLHYSGVP